MWVIDCSPLPDKAECGRAGNWATQAKREREGGVCSRADFHHLPSNPCLTLAPPEKSLSQTAAGSRLMMCCSSCSVGAAPLFLPVS